MPEIIIRAYVSDYDGTDRFALRIDGRYPPEYDFDNRDDARAAKQAITK